MYVDDQSFKCAAVVDGDPHKIEDLDNHCTIVEKDKDDVDFDFRSLGGRKLNKIKIKNPMDRKYGVVVNNVEMVFSQPGHVRSNTKKKVKPGHYIWMAYLEIR